jgi:hypothetical protein
MAQEIPAMPDAIRFHYIKSPFFRTIHVDESARRAYAARLHPRCDLQ